MEKPHSETPKSPFHCPLHHKSHLKSKTYHTLVQILSQCHKHPELYELPPIVPQELQPEDNQSNEPGEASEKDVCEHIEVSTFHGMDPNNSATQTTVSCNENFDPAGFQEGFCDTKAVIDEIENMMRVEEDDNPYKQRDLPVAVIDDTDETGLQGQGFGQLQQWIMDELEDVIKGNKEVSFDNVCNFATASLDESQNGGVMGTFSNNVERHLDFQPDVLEAFGNVDQQQVDKAQSSQNTFKTINSTLDKSITCGVPKLSDNHEENSSSLRNNQLEASHVMQQKEMESGKSMYTIDAVCSSDHMIEDGEMEEGEISGEIQVCGSLVDVSSEEVVVPQEQKQLSEDVADGNKFPSNDKKEANKKDSGSSSVTLEMVENMSDTRGAETKYIRNEMACKRKFIYRDAILVEAPDGYKKQKKGCGTKELKKGGGVNGANKGKDSASCARNADQIATGRQENTCKDELHQDAGLGNKKKRGPPSEEKKAKKKEKRRKKRAQKNWELGVKRLKLRPVHNPKPVALCRHYIRGRCQEGEKCKFSHETIPLTKSKPCCHFARHSCLKGDDCPFDHQLSKYPCANYVSAGSCSRGEDCMFSHELPLKEDLPSVSNVPTPDLKPQSLPGTSNSKKQPDTLGVNSCKNTEHNVAKSVVSPPSVVPKGISFLCAGKSSVFESSHSARGVSSLMRNEGFKVGNKTDGRTLGSIQNSNESPRGTPAAVPPMGINFLAFGKAPWEFSNINKLTGNSGAKLSLPINFDLTKQSASPLHTGNDIQVGKESKQSVSNTTAGLNKMLPETEFAAVPLKSNILLSGEFSTDGSGSSSQGSLPSNSATCADRSVLASAIAPEKSSAILQGLLASAHQSADYPWLKKTPKSAQKAFLSTLAFAAKVESEMKMKQSPIGARAVSGRIIKETGNIVIPDSHNDSTKA